MSKKLLKTIIFFVILLVVTSAISLLFLPEQVPLHYDFSMQIDRYGSKYELLLFPVIAILTGALLFFVGRYQGRKGNSQNEKGIALTNLSLLIFFNLLNLFFIILTYTVAKNDLLEFTDGLIALMAILFGLLFIVMGLIMPKLTLNGAIGLRTKWSMYNENTWNKSQKFGGLTFVIQGFLTIIFSIFLKEYWPMTVMLILLFADIILAFVSSYIFYKQEKQSELDR